MFVGRIATPDHLVDDLNAKFVEELRLNSRSGNILILIFRKE